MRRSGFLGWLIGYRCLRIPRSCAETFMNLCMRYGFVYSNFKISKDGESAELICSIYTSRRVEVACGYCGIPIERVYTRGLPHILYLRRKRVGILIGAVLSVALLIASQSVLWSVEVVGNERLEEREVIELLGSCGLRVGGKLSDLDIDSVENRAILNSDDISWLSINMSGTVARVEIRERIDTEVGDKRKDPANVVARLDGQIVGIEVYSGFLCVSDGDYVRAGQLLVSGLYDSAHSAYRYTRASARIFAKTLHTFTVEIPLEREVKVYIGGEKEKKTLNFFGKSIKLFGNSGNVGESCDIINYEYSFDPFGLGALPISVSVQRVCPYIYERQTLDPAEAEELAYYELWARIEAELPDAQLLKKSISVSLTESSYILNCTVVCIEDIAKILEFEIK